MNTIFSKTRVEAFSDGIFAIIWVNHHKLFKQFRKLNHGIFWWNALLLLWTSFIPFPTAVVGDYPGNMTSLVFYGLVMALMALSFTLMRWYVVKNPELLEETTDVVVFRKGTLLSLVFGPLLYLAGVAAAMIHPYVSFTIYLAVPVYFIFAERRS